MYGHMRLPKLTSLRINYSHIHASKCNRFIQNRSFSLSNVLHASDVQEFSSGQKTQATPTRTSSSNQVSPFRVAIPTTKSISVEGNWAELSSKALRSLLPISGAYSGRSVPVIQGDVARAYNKLSGILSRNRVWQELRLTVRHEKKGDKRRRLKSERWRRRFRNEVNMKVKLVKEIRRRDAV